MKEEKIGILIDEVMHSMSEVKKIMRNHMPPHAGDFRIPPHQFYCLNILYRNGTLSMSELAEKMAVSNQQLTRIVDSLSEGGFVERFISPENRRIVFVKLADAGTELVNSSTNHMKKQTAVILSDLTEQDIDELTGHIRSIKTILSKIIN